MVIDKENDYVTYNDEQHLYIEKASGKKCISVTTLIESFGQPFDSDFWASYKALEEIIGKDEYEKIKKELLSKKKFDTKWLDKYNILPEDFTIVKEKILDNWRKTNQEACERGTKIHKFHEELTLGGDCKEVKRLGLGGKFDCYTNNKIKLDSSGVYPEILLNYTSPDGSLRLAGQADLVIVQGKNLYVLDFKGLAIDTKIPTPKGWTTMGELKVGDEVFDKNGEVTKVRFKSKIHLNPCYKLKFDDGSEIIADCDHRWEISFSKGKDKWQSTVMTTKELCDYLDEIKDIKNKGRLIPKIRNAKPLQLKDVDLPIDPYVLGVWLGDGSKACGLVTQAKGSPIWDEIINRGYEISDNNQHDPERENTEMRTIYGLATQLRQLNLLNNKHIPDIYQRASFEQRLDLLRGLMDTDGYYNNVRKRYVMTTDSKWQKEDLVKLVSSLGVKVSVFDVLNRCDGKTFPGWSVNFSTTDFNPFLTRNQNIDIDLKSDKRTFRIIKEIKLVETVQTQCIEVDSPTHTYLCTENMIVTHNTNKEIKKGSYYNSATKSRQMMQYPLNHIQDCNFWHYTLQLSTYAWMIQKQYPELEVKLLQLIHYDHNDKVTFYDCEYRKDDVERMLKFYGSKIKREEQYEKLKPIVY